MLLLYLYIVFENHQISPNIFYTVTNSYDQDHTLMVNILSRTHFGVEGVHSYYFKSYFRMCEVYMMSFGNKLYRENVVRFGYRFNFQNQYGILIHVAGLNYWIKSHCARYNYALSTSLTWRKDKLFVKLDLENINTPQFSPSDRVPIVMRGQCMYTQDSRVSIIGALQSVQENIPSYAIGVQLSPHTHIIIGCGVVTNPSRLDYEVTIGHCRMLVSYFGNAHIILGLSHALALGVRL